MSDRRRMAKNSSALVAGQAATWLCAVAFAAVVPRNIGAAALGQYVFAFAFLTIAGALGGLGLEVHISRAIARDERPATVRAAIALGIGATVAAVALGSLVASFVSTSAAMVTLALAPGIVLQGGANLAFGALQGKERPTVRAGADVLAKLAFTAGSIVCALDGSGAVAVAWSFTAGYVIYALIAAAAFRSLRVPAASIERDEVGRVFKETAPMGGHLLAQTVYFRSDSALLEPLRSAREAGIYGAAYRLFDTATFVTTLFGAVLSPRLARNATHDLPAFRSLYRKGVAVMAGVGVMGAIGFAVTAGPVVDLLYGDAFDTATTPLRLLGVALMLACIATPPAWALVSFDEQRLLFRISAIAAVTNIAVNLVAIPRWGATGAATTTVITELVVAALSTAAAQRVIASRAAACAATPTPAPVA